MRILTIFGEILPVAGTIALLGLWLFQQTAVEHRVVELQRLASARAVYQTYQSNNALFNAINEVRGTNEKTTEKIRLYQMYNYEQGLAASEEALPASYKAGIPPRVNPYSSVVDIKTQLHQVQERLEKLQGKLAEREKAIGNAANKAKRTSLWIYFGISLLTILGAICKVLDKLAISRSN
jgi:hypothetical protein